MRGRLLKWLFDTPKSSEKRYLEHLATKRIGNLLKEIRVITVYEKDYRYSPPRVLPYVFGLVSDKISDEEFRRNVHFLADPEEEPGKPVDALRKEGAAGKGPLPCLKKDNSINNPK